MDEAGYVQGAADDTENWACGLTPTVFWAHVQDLLTASEAELPELIARLVDEHQSDGSVDGARKKLSQYVSVCTLPLDADSAVPTECRIALTAETTPKESWSKTPTFMQIGLGKSKTASRNLRTALPEICAFVSGFFSRRESSQGGQERIVIACDSSKDLSVGVALAIICYLFDEQGEFRVPNSDLVFQKTLVKARLGNIMTVYPEANPSRSTLQSVNSFLMDWRK
ncbi:hypothetical protein G7046_g10097 [Stylonectria norvegica]|nr:hypothetical protein G7046_g10097 [Stylonectria norvegica]